MENGIIYFRNCPVCFYIKKSGSSGIFVITWLLRWLAISYLWYLCIFYRFGWVGWEFWCWGLGKPCLSFWIRHLRLYRRLIACLIRGRSTRLRGQRRRRILRRISKSDLFRICSGLGSDARILHWSRLSNLGAPRIVHCNRKVPLHRHLITMS